MTRPVRSNCYTIEHGYEKGSHEVTAAAPPQPRGRNREAGAGTAVTGAGGSGERAGPACGRVALWSTVDHNI